MKVSTYNITLTENDKQSMLLFKEIEWMEWKRKKKKILTNNNISYRTGQEDEEVEGLGWWVLAESASGKWEVGSGSWKKRWRKFYIPLLSWQQILNCNWLLIKD